MPPEPNLTQLLNVISKKSYTTSIQGKFHFHGGSQCRGSVHHTSCPRGGALITCRRLASGVYQCTHGYAP
jgi:hypothetical protein